MSRQHQKSKRSQTAEIERRAAKRRGRMLRSLLLGGIVVLVVGGGLFLLSEADPVATGNTTTTAWDLPSLDSDERIALADFEGTPLVAAFFADWCPHCRRELPHYVTVSDSLGDEVAWVGINSQNSGAGLGFAREMGIDRWPLARDVGGQGGSALSNAFGARGMPLTVFYNTDGTVADVQIGPLTETQLRDRLQRLFGVT